MEQTIPWPIFCLAFLGLSIWRLGAARVFIGLFFDVMDLAVNWVLALADPQAFVGLGTDAPLLSAYEWVFTEVVARAPQAVGFAAGAGEAALGVLMLSRGRWARLGHGPRASAPVTRTRQTASTPADHARTVDS